jgi:hypothetical protein
MRPPGTVPPTVQEDSWSLGTKNFLCAKSLWKPWKSKAVAKIKSPGRWDGRGFPLTCVTAVGNSLLRRLSAALPSVVASRACLVSEIMREMSRKGGEKGGKARMASLTPTQRSEVARKAATASATVRSKKAVDKLATPKKPGKKGK